LLWRHPRRIAGDLASTLARTLTGAKERYWLSMNVENRWVLGMP